MGLPVRWIRTFGTGEPAAAGEALLAAAGCASSGSSANASGSGQGDCRTLNIVYFASVTANWFSNAVWQAMRAEAAKLGNVKLRELDGNFSATTQFDQIAVARDVRLGLVSAEAARDAYGMAVTGDFRVDTASTDRLRLGRTAP